MKVVGWFVDKATPLHKRREAMIDGASSHSQINPILFRKDFQDSKIQACPLCINLQVIE
jgi:hypothetical protein